MYTSVNTVKRKYHSHFKRLTLCIQLVLLVYDHRTMKRHEGFFSTCVQVSLDFQLRVESYWWVHETDHNINTTLMLCSDAAVKVVVLIVLKKHHIEYVEYVHNR